MTLRKKLIAAVAVGALAVPAMTVSVWTLSATPAFAKGNNNKGGGGRSSSRGNSGSHKPAQTRSQRNGNGNGGARANRGAGSANVIRGNGANRPAVASSAPTSAEATDLAPNQLGSMNGAMHANINAVLAHIRNGNTNGPVGALAALAVADAGASEAQGVIEEAAIHTALESDLALAVLNNETYETLEDYLAAAEEEGFEPDPVIEDALAALEAADTPPSDEEIAEAEAALEAQTAAEDGILAAWNKSDAASEEEQAALLEALRARLDAEADAIAEAIGTPDASAEPDATGEEVATLE